MFGLRQTDLNSIIEVLQSYREVESAIIFGSRSKGDYKNGSDVDIALKGTTINHRLITRISYLLNEETLMPYKFDVLDYQTISNKNLTAHIDRAGKVFYERR